MSCVTHPLVADYGSDVCGSGTPSLDALRPWIRPRMHPSVPGCVPRRILASPGCVSGCAPRCVWGRIRTRPHRPYKSIPGLTPSTSSWASGQSSPSCRESRERDPADTYTHPLTLDYGSYGCLNPFFPKSTKESRSSHTSDLAMSDLAAESPAFHNAWD